MEPNNDCASAQDFGSVTLPFTVSGSLNTPPGTPDVDFFKITGTPGASVRLDLEGADTARGTLGDPFLGILDSSCNFIAFDDDGGAGRNSQLSVTFPADGILIVAATSYYDNDFTGDGLSSGSYILTLSAVSFAGSISGRVVDATTGTPLPGVLPPFGRVDLARCFDSDCFEVEIVNSSATNDTGRFSFTQDLSGTPLTTGTYLVFGFGEGYQPNSCPPFPVREGENVDIGDISLTPSRVQFSEVTPCGELPPEGGRCKYSVRVQNATTDRITGSVWSIVDSDFTGSFLGYTMFQTGKAGPQSPVAQKINLRPGESRVMHFQFSVPVTVPLGAYICTNIFAGQNPNPSFNTLGHAFLFCVTKGAAVFEVISEKKVFQQKRNPLRKIFLRR
jgi:5-hydroxyisourate hydrolase-like protein (transthyretin family)